MEETILGREQCLGLHGWCNCVRVIFTTSARNAHKIGLFILLCAASYHFDTIKYITTGGITIELERSAQKSISSLSTELEAEKDSNTNLRQINTLLQHSCRTQMSTQGGFQKLDATSGELPKLLQRQDILDDRAKEFSLTTEKSLQDFKKVRQNIFKTVDK